MSFEEKPPQKDLPPKDDKSPKYPDIDTCIKDQVSKGETPENAQSLCEKLVEKSPEEAPKDEAPKEEGIPKEEAPSKEAPPEKSPESPVKEITPDGTPQEVPKEDGLPQESTGFGEYENFEACLQDQLAQGLNNKDSVVNCAAQLLQTLESNGIAQPQGEGQYNVNGAKLKVADFEGFEQCVHAMKKDGMEKEEATAKCQSIFSAKIKKVNLKESKKDFVPEPIRIEEASKDSNRLYVRAFLLDPSVNLNDWGVAEASIEDRIYSFVGKPLVLTENFDHPQLSDMTFGHALQYQDIYRIGTIVDVARIAKGQYAEKIYYAICEITDENAKKAFKENKLPLYVSPALAQLNLTEDGQNIENWAGLHLAVVDQPAFGIKKAMITGQCAGDKDTCVMNLRQAHIEKHGYGNCGFCTYAKLTSVLTANKAVEPKIEAKVENIVNNADSSQVPENIVEKVTMTEAEKVEAKTEEVQVKQAEEKSLVEETGLDFVDAKLLKLESENNVLREQYKLASSKIKELESVISKQNYSIRRERIANIVTADLIPDADTRARTIETFTERNLTPEMVAEIYDTVKGSIKTAKTYDAKVPLVRAASKAANVDFESQNLSKEVRKMFIRKDGAN